MRNERGNSRRTQHIEATGDEGRGGGNQTVEERIADLLSADEHGIDDAFAKQEAAAAKARSQWWPENWSSSNPGYRDPMNCPDMPAPQGRGPKVSQDHTQLGYGNHATYDPNRPNPGVPPNAEEKGECQGMGKSTKDWRAESSRIGRYWHHPEFATAANGTWTIQPGGSNQQFGHNPFEVHRAGLFLNGRSPTKSPPK